MGHKSLEKNRNGNKKTDIPLRNFMKAVESSSDGIAMADSQGRHYYHNRAFENLLGYSLEELTKIKSLEDIYVDRKTGEKAFETVINGGEWEGEVRMASKNGKIHHIHLRAYGIKNDEGDVSHLVGIHTDMSEKKQYMELLENERNQLLSIFESINEPVYVADMESHEVLFVNRALQKSLSKNPVGCKCYREFQSLDSPCSFCTNEIIKNRYPESHRWEYYNAKIDRTFYLHDRMFMWPDGRYVRLEIAFDITERKKAEEELRESEENLRITLESIGDAVIATDINGRITRMNPVAEKLTGWASSEAHGENLSNVFRIFNSDTGKTVKSPVKKVLESGEIVGLANHTVLISKNGHKYQISDSGAPIKNKLGEITGVVLVFRDIS
ncbi:MAG: PAS domain S-box protein [bacterium]